MAKPLKTLTQSDVTKLMSELKVAVLPRHRNLSSPLGPEGRINKLRQTVTALLKYERIELFENRADEARGYVERVSL
jgi:large subunit ribosomal protein L17